MFAILRYSFACIGKSYYSVIPRVFYIFIIFFAIQSYLCYILYISKLYHTLWCSLRTPSSCLLRWDRALAVLLRALSVPEMPMHVQLERSIEAAILCDGMGLKVRPWCIMCFMPPLRSMTFSVIVISYNEVMWYNIMTHFPSHTVPRKTPAHRNPF